MTKFAGRYTLLAGVLLAGVALALAVIPFKAAISAGPLGTLRLNCGAPVVAAWDTRPKDQLSLWAVTVGTEMRGFTVVRGSQGPWCGDRARHQLVLSGVFLVATAGLGAVAMRGRRHSTAIS